MEKLEQYQENCLKGKNGVYQIQEQFCIKIKWILLRKVLKAEQLQACIKEARNIWNDKIKQIQYLLIVSISDKGCIPVLEEGSVSASVVNSSSEDAQKYLNVTQPAYHDRVLSFAELANRFSKKNLDSLSREEVIEICNKAISDANISAVFENAFAMDCETLNQLQRDAKSQYGEDFYMAPGSEYLSNEDGTGKWNVTQWEKEQEAYYVVYRMQLNGRTLDTTGSLCKIELFCRADGQIIYANGNCPELTLADAKSEE